MDEKQIRGIVSEILKNTELSKISPRTSGMGIEVNVEASGHHVHLSQSVLEELFGKGYRLTEEKPLSQPGQFMCKERVTVIGKKGQIERVAVLGPVRENCQVELSKTDCVILGVNPPVALSGELSEAKDLYLKNGDKIVKASKAVIVPHNHVHVSKNEAAALGLAECKSVDVFINAERPVTFHKVPVRISDKASFNMHIDYDEANACGFAKGQKGLIISAKTDIKTDVTNAGVKMDSKKTTVTYEAKLLSESAARDYANSKIECLQIKKKTIITPGAKDILRSGKINLQYLE